MGTEFVAAHVWRTVHGTDTLASRIPTLNSFVPNLVWLPGQIAKLTDREGGVVQQTLQALAWVVYRDAPVSPHLKELVEGCWAQLPQSPRRIEPVDSGNLNWFVSSPQFFQVRERRLAAVIDALVRVRDGLPLQEKVVTTRYTEGLPGVSAEAVEALLETLATYEPSPRP